MLTLVKSTCNAGGGSSERGSDITPAARRGELEAEHTEALAVALAKDGWLQAAADYCLGLVRSRRHRGRNAKVSSGAVLLY